MPRDHVKLISDLSELVEVFHDAQSLEAFLQKIVALISEHMRSEVCSIYLYYDNTQELVLKATKGLNLDSVGQVKMKLGEGLTGLALQEARAICEKHASRNPHFKHFPGIGEERYESFLAVPMIRGQTKIGVMVIQNSQRNYFSEQDIQAFRAITSQLANTIETAKLLMALNDRPTLPTAAVPAELKFIKGRAGSPGFALAEAVVIDLHHARLPAAHQQFPERYTLEDFSQAVRQTEEQLEDLQNQIEEHLSDIASLIFTAQILMLKDKGFMDGISELIQNGVNPPNAIIQTVESYTQKFEAIANPYLREKKQDVLDIGKRLLENLLKINHDGKKYAGHIMIAQELLPSDILKLSTQGVRGIIVLSGGASSHLAILARSLLMPMVIADTPELLALPPQTKVLLDAEIGNIYVNPGADVIKTFEQRNKERALLHQLKDSIAQETKTKDGTKITLLSNINLLSDVKMAREYQSEGIGLYRTEFPFLVRSNFPTEEEQYVIYRKLVDGMKDKEITFRTLDIGGDKVLSYYNFGKEENPFLGMRSIRFSLKHKEIFEQQIRAILRAGAGVHIRIMFPMVSSLDEFLEAKDVVLKCARDLAGEKIEHNAKPDIGMMIELPSVLEILEELAQAADFFSIGTNDFIQYMLAVDRTNEKVADFYLPQHPAVLRALNRIAKTAQKYKKDISICGDMAQDTRYLMYFLGIGIRKFSINSDCIPRIQAAIAQVDLARARKEAKRILSQVRVSETSAIFEQK
ncbi:MAG: phosphoenolpyruvate--protein phosphotransferase [Omnitrophica WOR_2 bacterium RIFCSPHIGHO2_01_FULL_48_9]|nr:MAG: phosphoenolpyruvate--protein phosphotransferase [Omnitrophica WOR_2 bacterium RIFCSPHIGHO2_02_FULL_48_11]OGX33157.1 MAG: phosphoenolpyruvate--protein phosphotransferase [Omnitrophica WOR_2 bacterium RIFCSPHIGHO2_01_FULL_48_9]